MLKVAICDDEKPIREHIKKLIEQCIQAETDLYARGEDLLMADKEYDILLLDICLKESGAGQGMSGMDTARSIRKKSDAVIIFITAFEDYACDAYDVEAFHYLLKPVDEVKFCEVIRKAAAKAAERKAVCPLIIKVSGAYRQIPVEDIYYAENDARKIILHTRTENITYYEKMEVLEQKLGADFFRSHRGFLVHLSEVAGYDRNSITLKCGDSVFLAKQKYNDFVTAYMNYLTR